MPKSKQNKSKKAKKPKLKSVSFYKKKLDAAFSIYIRQRDKGVCFTCGVKKPIKSMQAGHYVSRSHNATRFDPKNVNCQCFPCNICKHGNMDVYALKLQEKYGDGILLELAGKKQQVKQFTRQELIALIATYEELVKLGIFNHAFQGLDPNRIDHGLL